MLSSIDWSINELLIDNHAQSSLVVRLRSAVWRFKPLTVLRGVGIDLLCKAGPVRRWQFLNYLYLDGPMF